MTPLILKVCGMRQEENIRQVEETLCRYASDRHRLHIRPWMGFIFYEKSPRYVTENPAYLPSDCKRVGVFVNEHSQKIKQRIREYGLHAVQLHGNESPETCRDLRQSICNDLHEDTKIIKAFSLSNEEDLHRVQEFEGACHYFLFDTKCSRYGGSGKKFDWSILRNYTGHTPFLLSGGIGPADIADLQHFHHPQLAGYDLNSCFEKAPALKDPCLIEAFLQSLSSSSEPVPYEDKGLQSESLS